MNITHIGIHIINNTINVIRIIIWPIAYCLVLSVYNNGVNAMLHSPNHQCSTKRVKLERFKHLFKSQQLGSTLYVLPFAIPSHHIVKLEHCKHLFKSWQLGSTLHVLPFAIPSHRSVKLKHFKHLFKSQQLGSTLYVLCFAIPSHQIVNLEHFKHLLKS